MKVLAMGNVELHPHLGSGKTRLGWKEGFAKEGHLYEPVQPSQFELFAGRVSAGRKYRQALGAFLWFLREKKWLEYDVVEFHGDEFWLATLWLSWLKRRPLVIASTDGLELLAYERRAFDDMNRGVLGPLKKMVNYLTHESLGKLAFSRADRFASICKLDADYIQKNGYFPPEHCVVAPPGIDPEYRDCPTSGPKEHAIAFNGSWIDRKGVKTLIKAVDILMREDARLQFHVFGTGGKEELVQSSFDESLRGRIQVFGRLPVAELAAGLARCKVFLFPSEYEGFGIALAEGMACSCACVTTPTGYGWELVDGEEAFLCPFGDHEKMAAAARRLLQDEALFIRVSQQGRARALQLSWESSARALVEAYGRWVGEFQGKGKE